MKKGDTARFYHRQLTTILNSLDESNEKLKNVAIQFEDNSIHHFDISCPLMYIILDTEGADKICGQYACHTVGEVKSHCRICDVDSKNLDDENYNFQYLKICDMHQISVQGTLEQQVQYSQHAVCNAFHAVNFGGQDYGLLFATSINCGIQMQVKLYNLYINTHDLKYFHTDDVIMQSLHTSSFKLSAERTLLRIIY